MIPDDFGVLILTNKRPDRVKTYKTLKKGGYSGRIYIIVDNLDPTIDEYKKIFGDLVVIFDKEEISKTFDKADNFNDMRAICYARNASFVIAKNLGLKTFVQLDDDYTDFSFRFDKNLDYNPKTIKNLDFIFDKVIKFMNETNIDTIAFSQGGDFIGGEYSDFSQTVKLKRKAMNSFFCKTDKPFKFLGRVNEDVNTYTYSASLGLLLFTMNQVSLTQMQTQTNSGGMTEMYLDSGTYLKSFYSVIFQPSSVKIGILNSKFKRIHHIVSWKNTVPKILRESVKK